MKKGLLVILMVMLSMSAFGQTITFLHAGDTVVANGTAFGMAEAKLKKDYPNVKIAYMKIDLSDGSTLTMDAMLAAGNAPNVYQDSTVRAGKYMLPEFALPLDGVRDLNKYSQSALAPYIRGGKLLAIPCPAVPMGMAINLDVMKEIGYTVPKDWTIDDFLKMAELVKQKYKGKVYPTGMFAANQSGDYLINCWHSSFGIEWYQNGNHDKVTFAETGGYKVYEWFQKLVKNEYVPPNAASLSDDDYVSDWPNGKLAASAFSPGWTKNYFDTALANKTITKPFEYTFVPFPRAPGVKKVPTYINNGVTLVHKTGNKLIDDIAVRFVEYLGAADIQSAMTLSIGVAPTRTDSVQPKDYHVAEVMQIVAANGYMDVGLTDPRFTERRALQFPILQQVLNLKIDPKVAAEKFDKALESVKR